MRETLKDTDEVLLLKDKILLQVLSAAYWLLLLPAFEFGADLMFIHAVRDQKLDFKNLLAGFRNYLNVVLAHLLVAALVGIALIALIIPGIFVACRLAFVFLSGNRQKSGTHRSRRDQLEYDAQTRLENIRSRLHVYPDRFGGTTVTHRGHHPGNNVD